MRLMRLELTPYGRFADHALNFRPDAGLHVVLGANESGKTTTLSAIGDLLFGFPGQTPYDFVHDKTLLRIGGAFRLADGAELSVRRRKGNKDTLRDAADRPIPEDSLRRALGFIDRKTFESEFGLTARALREGGEALLRAGGGLAETLAAGSASLSALSRLRERLSAEADEQFTPHRSGKKPFYVALESYEKAAKALRDSMVTADALKAANERLLAASAKQNEHSGAYDEASRALAKLERAQRTHRMLGRLGALKSELASFADLPEIDAGWLSAWRKALDQDRALRAELARLAAEAEAEAAEAALLVIDEALIAQGAEIDAWGKNVSAVRKAADDLPRRVEARAQALAQLDDIARRLGLPDYRALLSSPPSDAELAKARIAIVARLDAERRLNEARVRARDAASKRNRLAAETRDNPPVDPEPMRRRLEPLGERVADADRLRRERAAIETQERALADDAMRLDPAIASLDAMARAAWPDAGALAKASSEELERAKARQTAEGRLADAARAVKTAVTELAKREAEAAGATRADWIVARERRERGLDRLGEALDRESETRRAAFDDARGLVQAADAIGDAVVADTERAARLQTAREDLAARREALAEAERDARRLAAERVAADSEWAADWARAGVVPKTPSAMARWADRVNALLDRRAEISARRAEAAALAEGLQEAGASLARWFADLGLVAPDHFELAYREAREECEARRKLWLAAREAALALTNAVRADEEAQSDVVQRERELAEIAAGWARAMQGLRLGAEAVAAEAEAALEAWRAVALPRQNMARETRSIEGIEGDLGTFEAGVRAIVARVAPELGSLNGEAALGRLAERLDEARRAAAERARFEKSAAHRDARRRIEEGRRQALAATLDQARDRLGSRDEAELALALERCEARRALAEELAQLRQRLTEVGDDLSEAELRAEQELLDPLLLSGELARARSRCDELLQAIPEAARAVRDAEADLANLSQGSDAAGAARERREAGGELVDIAERWILRQTAARLAARAIERHRAAAQDPLVERAGELFALATAGAFSGLVAVYDDADRPILAARRASGGKPVTIEGLSEGARDQLFLSLRLALLERRAGEPLPFIGDDILASFDDERASRALSMLAAFGASRQTILFTHHAHVADIARGLNSAAIEIVEM